jgi:hypothetical protein
MNYEEATLAIGVFTIVILLCQFSRAALPSANVRAPLFCNQIALGKRTLHA